MNELRDRIADVMYRELSGKYGDFTTPTEAAQAIIDEFDLTTNGETGYVEIWGCYDTRFEE